MLVDFLNGVRQECAVLNSTDILQWIQYIFQTPRVQMCQNDRMLLLRCNLC